MLSLLLFYLLLLLAVFIWQRKIIYFPDAYTHERHRQAVEQTEFRYWPTQEDYRGIISRSPGPFINGTIIVFHGNAGSAIDRSYFSAPLEQLGYRVIIAEYPGYGARPGEPSEQALIEDGKETVKRALQDFGEPVFLWTESLGGGVAGGIIQSGQLPIKGAVLITPFDSMSNIAQHHYWFVLGKWLLRDRYDNIRYWQNYRGRCAMILAGQDSTVPNRYSLHLFESLQGPKKLWTFRNAGHNSLPYYDGLPWWSEVMRFVDAPERDTK